MSYNQDLPADNIVAIRENFRALKEEKIVAAATTVKLETARNINGVSFDGTADITITQVNGKEIASIDEIPTSLPANGGDADTLDGHHWSEVHDAIAANDFDAGHSFNSVGYQKLATGLIIQWGRINGVPHTDEYGRIKISYPIPFPIKALTLNTNVVPGDVSYNVLDLGWANSNSNFYVYSPNNLNWTAIGY